MKQITCPHCGDTYPDFDVAHVCSKGPYAPRLKPKMNERIKELMEQAGIDVEAVENIGEMPTAIKFAELIVRECAELTLDYKSETYYNGWLDYRDEIKKHFGVEQ